MGDNCFGTPFGSGHYHCIFKDQPDDLHFKGHRYCRFHLPMGEPGEGGKADWDDRQKAEISNYIVARIREEIARPEGGTKCSDFRGAVVPSKLDLSNENLPLILIFDAAQFIDDALFKGAQFTDDANFSGTHFAARADFEESNFASKARFRGAEFAGDAEFKKTEFTCGSGFENAQFAGMADFRGTQFASAFFKGAKFTRLAVFDGAQFASTNSDFGGSATFNGAHFYNIATFMGAKFNGSVDFEEAHFNGWAGFVGAQFIPGPNSEGSLPGHFPLFSNVYFALGANFANTIFAKGAKFEKTNFSGDADFTAAQFTNDLQFTEARFGGSAMFAGSPDLAKTNARSFDNLTFENAFFGGEADFSNREFRARSNFRVREFRQAPKFHGSAFHQNTRFGGIDSFSDVTSDGAGIAYRTLRLAMQGLSAWAEEGMFYTLERKARRRARQDNGVAALISWGYELGSNFGLSIARPMLWLFGGVFASAVLAYAVGRPARYDESALWIDAISFSLRQSFIPFDALRTPAADLINNYRFIHGGAFWFQIWGLLQSLYSALTVLLLVLAVRWRYRR